MKTKEDFNSFKMDKGNVKILTGIEADLYVFTIEQINEVLEAYHQEKIREELTIQEFMNDVHEWADNTFGKERTAIAPLYHLKKEVNEAIKAMQDGSLFPIREELADCFILVLNATSKYGIEFNTLFFDAKEKMEKNKKRKWGKPDRNGVVEHDRTKDTITTEDLKAESDMYYTK